MTWRGVPRGRTGAIRLSDQGVRDLRSSVDAVGRFAVGFAAGFSRSLRREIARLTERADLERSMLAVGIPPARIEASRLQGIDQMRRLYAAWISGGGPDA